MKPNLNSGFFTRRHGKTEAQLRGHRPDEAAAIEEFIAKKGVTRVKSDAAMFHKAFPHVMHDGIASHLGDGGRVNPRGGAQ